MRITPVRGSLIALMVVALAGAGATTASAHIQVDPTEAAPDDAVRFDVLIPGERPPNETTKVELAVPEGVLPYSYGETPGWDRDVIVGKSGAVDRIVWTGRLDPEGFAEFSFLAATPPEAGTTLEWDALQTYSDGKVVRWIGAPDSENPAPTTLISDDVPIQNAGGEGAGKAEPTSSPEQSAPNESSTSTSSSDDDWVARGVALAALVAALIALGVVLAGRGERR